MGLIGGNVLLEGGNLTAPQGRIELGGVGSNSLVRLIPNSNNFSLGYEGVDGFQDIQLSQQTVVDASGVGGGDIQIQGRRVSVRDGSQVLTITQGSQPGGNLTVRGAELVEVSGNNPANFTRLSSDTIGGGAGGNLTVEAGQFLLQGTAFLSSSTLGEGSGGNLTLHAFDRAVLVGTGFNALEQYVASAFLGQLLPTTRIGGLFASTAAGGRGGDIAIETGSLNLLNGAIVSAPTFGSASGSNINLRVTHSIESFGCAIATAANSQGSAGNITLTTNQLTVKDSSVVSSFTFSRGHAGDIAIAASDFADISDTRPSAFFPTGITNNSFGTGVGGNVRIATGRLFNRGGAIISSNSGGAAIRTGVIPFGGRGGNVEIEARESVEISGTVNFT
ncbi:hemagglutination activity domain protein [Microseira wollei NIES-4236]|uniref:Hemagglutination activity domain protein n=1 Tax=Microseira wollei NIES-4236 TaxID=2530354 RepID=A0AAV3X5S5_9CYAN|nr:hemagglutination activity domain protein [Microseira wollei NIES-4236]